MLICSNSGSSWAALSVSWPQRSVSCEMYDSPVLWFPSPTLTLLTYLHLCVFSAGLADPRDCRHEAKYKMNSTVALCSSVISELLRNILIFLRQEHIEPKSGKSLRFCSYPWRGHLGDIIYSGNTHPSWPFLSTQLGASILFFLTFRCKNYTDRYREVFQRKLSYREAAVWGGNKGSAF